MSDHDLRFECLRQAAMSSQTVDANTIVKNAAIFEAYIKGEGTGATVKATKAVKAVETSPGVIKTLPVKDVQSETEDASKPELTYQDVKNAVLEVAKIKGREASLDLLAEFNTEDISVVTGTGNDRKGNMDKLKPYPELWEKVIARAKEVSAL